MRFEIFESTENDISMLDYKDCFSGEISVAQTVLGYSVKNNDNAIVRSFGLCEDDVLGVVGAIKVWDGNAQLWAVFDRRTDKYPISLTKACEACIKLAAKELNLRRVSFTVKSDYTNGHKFANHLGFVFEGRMMGYLPDGSDADLYARLF
jgi:hypothetical protein